MIYYLLFIINCYYSELTITKDRLVSQPWAYVTLEVCFFTFKK